MDTRTFPRARDAQSVPRGQWTPIGKGGAMLRCPECGTAMLFVPEEGAELHCPKDGCAFFCTPAQLEHYEVTG